MDFIKLSLNQGEETENCFLILLTKMTNTFYRLGTQIKLLFFGQDPTFHFNFYYIYIYIRQTHFQTELLMGKASIQYLTFLKSNLNLFSARTKV